MIQPIDKVVNVLKTYTNEDLRNLLKEIRATNTSKRLSIKADYLFKCYNNDDWKIGLERFSEIRHLIEQIVIERIENDKF